jgi:ethanolamine ammonia-lyase large subunit
LVRYGRVKLSEAIADRLGVELVIHLIGERPGGDARSACSLSAYFVYRLADGPVQARAAAFSHNPSIRFESSVISNIYPEGMPPIEAGAVIAERALAILSHKAAGNRLEILLRTGDPML